MNNILLKSPEARLVVHAFLMGLGVFFTAWSAAGFSFDKAIVLAAVATGARAVVGLLFSTNPQVGKNIL